MKSVDSPNTAGSQRQLRVFLCHSSNDKPQVRDLHRRLKADGIEPWLDEEDLLPGQNWEKEISRAVRTSDIVLVCLSNGSVDKVGFVQKEIKYALDVADEQPEDTIYLIPLKLEECRVPDRLSKVHWVNLFDENGYQKLMRSLQKRAEAIGARVPFIVVNNADVEKDQRLPPVIPTGDESNSYVYGGTISPGPNITMQGASNYETHKELFAQQRQNWVGPILDQLTERGYWEIIIHPINFVSDLIRKKALQPLIEHNAVSKDGWYLPLLISSIIERGSDWVEGEVERALTAPEAWRLYQSGQFVDRYGFWDDWRDKAFGSAPAEWRPGQLLEVEATIGILTMAFLLAARFAETPEFSSVDSLYIRVKAAGMQGRTLYVAGGTPLWSANKCTISEHVQESKIERQDLLDNYRDYAIEAVEDVFWLFGFDMDKNRMLDIQSTIVPPTGLR